jgi:membrane protein implicated in regulation of membrane protease activity
MISHKSISNIVVGLVLIALGLLTQQVMPILGRVAYQAAATGSYSPEDFHVELVGYYIIAGIVVVLGIVNLYTDWRRGTNNDF